MDHKPASPEAISDPPRKSVGVTAKHLKSNQRLLLRLWLKACSIEIRKPKVEGGTEAILGLTPKPFKRTCSLLDKSNYNCNRDRLQAKWGL